MKKRNVLPIVLVVIVILIVLSGFSSERYLTLTEAQCKACSSTKLLNRVLPRLMPKSPDFANEVLLINSGGMRLSYIPPSTSKPTPDPSTDNLQFAMYITKNCPVPVNTVYFKGKCQLVIADGVFLNAINNNFGWIALEGVFHQLKFTNVYVTGVMNALCNQKKMSLNALTINFIPQLTQAQTGDPDLDIALNSFVIDNSQFASPANPTCVYDVNSCPASGCSAIIKLIQPLIDNMMQQNPIMFDMGAEADFICP